MALLKQNEADAPKVKNTRGRKKTGASEAEGQQVGAGQGNNRHVKASQVVVRRVETRQAGEGSMNDPFNQPPYSKPS